MIRIPANIIRTCLFILLLQSGFFASSQSKSTDYQSIVDANKRDTAQVNALNNLFLQQSQVNPIQAKSYLDSAYFLASEINYKIGKAESLLRYGDFYTASGEYKKAKKAINEAFVIYKKMTNIQGVVLTLNSLGKVAIRKGDYSLAMSYYLEGLKLNNKIHDSKGISYSYQGIGGIHYTQKRYDEALIYWEKSLRIKESLKDSSGMVISLNAISVVYTARGNYEKALNLQFRTLKIAKRVSDPFENASILNNIGVQYYYLDKPDSSRFYYIKALNIYKKFDEKQQLTFQYINLGGIELLIGEALVAKAYFDTSLAIIKETGGSRLEASANHGLSEASTLLGDHEKAKIYIERYYFLKDSLIGEKVQLQINELQEKYEAEIKDNEITKLEKNNAEANSVSEKRKSWLTFTISIFIVSALILIMYLRIRKSKEKQLTAELEQKALRAQMNPHFIFNSLNSIQRLYIEGEEDIANDYMADFSNLLRRILENSSMDKVSLKEELRSSILYLDLEKMRTDNLFTYEIEVDPKIDQLNFFVPPLIFQPYIENSIWHGIVPKDEQGNITLQIGLLEANVLECIITDNGIGMKESMNQKSSTMRESKGMSITADRLGGENYVFISELESGGTEVKLRLTRTK